MQSEEFNEIIRKRIAKSTDVLVKKAGEYADDGDRLHNFRAAAGLTGQSMREALGGMMLKHTVSIYDMIRNADVDYPQEMWDEKLGDHLNYLLLLDAVVADEKNELAEKAAIEYIRNDVEKTSSAFIPNYSKDSEPNATIKNGRYRVFAERDVNIPNVYNVLYPDKKTMGAFYAHEIELDSEVPHVKEEHYEPNTGSRRRADALRRIANELESGAIATPRTLRAAIEPII